MKVKTTAKAVRSGVWWAIEVDYGTGLSTQARRLDQAPAMAADAIASVAQIPVEDVEVDVQVTLNDDVRAALDEVQAMARTAEAARASAAKASRDLVTRLRGAGMSTRDVGHVMGVSHQRVAQLGARRSV